VRIASHTGLAVCAALAALVSTARAADLIGRERAELAWAPSTGAVSAYVVFVSRDGGPYRSEQYTREPRAVVSGRAGETLHVRVRAYGVDGARTLASAPSDASEPIRFLPPEATAPAAVGSAPPTASTGTPGVRRLPGFEFAPQITVQAQGDFDGDGNLDLIATLGSWRHPLALFLKSGSLEQVVVLPALSPGSSAFGADFDGDGRAELAVKSADQLAVLRVERSGKLVPLMREALPVGARVLAADLDGDGSASLVVYEPDTGRLTERLSKGKPIDFGSIQPLYALYTGDFDGDGRDDLWVQSAPGPNAELWLMRPGGTFVVEPVRLDRSVSTAVVADVNGDGRADLAGYDAARGELRAWLLDGGRVIGERLIANEPIETLRGGDIDGDGVDDLLIGKPGGEAVALLLAR